MVDRDFVMLNIKFVKSVFVFLFIFFTSLILFKFLVFYTKIEYRKIRISYISENLLDYHTISEIEKKGKIRFSSSLISIWERKEIVFEFKEELKKEEILNISLFLQENFSENKWKGPNVRRQEFLTKKYINKIFLLISIVFALGASFAYFLERSKNE